MSLRIIYGKSGTGKSTYICNEIEENNSNLICFNNWNDIYSYIQTIK